MFADGMAAILPHARAVQGAARDRAAASDVCGGPRLHLAALARRSTCATRSATASASRSTPIICGGTRTSQRRSRAPAARILAHHICDWLVPTKDLLLDRGMMGDGVIDLPGIRRMVEAAGFHGHQEVEIFSAENWWKRPGDEVMRTCIERYNTVC